MADTPKNVETVSLLWRHGNFDMGLVDKRVGTLYNDNGTITYMINGLSLPYPVDQAITINPFNQVNVFANYTIKNRSLFPREQDPPVGQQSRQQPQPCRNYARRRGHDYRAFRAEFRAIS